MNTRALDVLNYLYEHEYMNQRILAEQTGHSLGNINKCLKELLDANDLDADMHLTNKAKARVRATSPKSAIILAAGLGMRMVPINMEVPKGLIEVQGEPLIERLIKQLKEVGIDKIFIVVGFMKEKFEYLIDTYGVELVVNTQYASRNNLFSLSLLAEHIDNTYIVPCDIWFRQNPFRRQESYSWYMLSKGMSQTSRMKATRKYEIVRTEDGEAGNGDIGIAYITSDVKEQLCTNLKSYVQHHRYDHSFWEETLYCKDKMAVAARLIAEGEAIEINTYEQLREVDSHSTQLKSDSIQGILQHLHIAPDEIHQIRILKKGMTNRSFLFSSQNEKYIMRIPETGTEKLIDRQQEAAVYHALQEQNFCETVIYIDPQSGEKLSKYIENARVCDAKNSADVSACMQLLKQFHQQKLQVAHVFDVVSQIEFYERLWDGEESYYRDYKETKQKVLSLQEYISGQNPELVLTHVDPVPENFLFTINEHGENEVRLIDWEYAGMADPHMDIAMFGIYALYDRTQMDQLIDLYFEGNCPKNMRLKIYCYIAMCGLFWSNWCEYKRNQGIEFGEYALRQYRYAKEYYRIVQSEIE